MSKLVTLVNSLGAGELSPEMRGRVDHEKFYSGCITCVNGIIRPFGTLYRRPGTRHVVSSKFPGQTSILQDFDFNGTASQSYMLEFGHLYMRVHKDRATVLDSGGTPYELVTPWTAAQVQDLFFWQSADVLYVAHPNVQTRTITRTGHAAWSIAVLDTRIPGHDWAEVTDASADGKADGKAGDSIVIPAGKIFEIRMCLQGQTPDGADQMFLYLGDGIFDNSEGTTAMTVTFADDPDTASEIEAIYNSKGVLQAEWMLLDSEDSAPEEWTGTNWPGMVGCFQDRLVLAKTPGEPLGFWMSRTSDWAFFVKNTSQDGTPLDDDAVWSNVQGTGTSMSPIQWMMDQDDLLFGTNSSEIIVTSGSSSDPVSAERCFSRRQTAYGSNGVRTLLVGSSVIFVSRTGRKVRQFGYRYEDDAYRSEELTLLAQHVTGPGIVDMAYAVEPDGVLWCARSDGKLCACTYLPEQKIVGWHRHELGGDGRVESLRTIPGSRGDELWLIVRRELDGVVRRDIEILEFPFDPQNEDGTVQTDARDAFYVDSGLSYEGAAVSSVSGLDHLEGREVHILADGDTHVSKVVVDGSVALDRPASTVHVGLSCPLEVTPMPFNVIGNPLALLGKKRRVTAVTLRLLNSVGGSVRGGSDTSIPFVELDTMNIFTPPGDPPQLFNGDCKVALAGSAESDALLTIRQDKPWPMNIICMTPELEVT